MTQQLHAFQAQVFQGLAHPTRIAIVEALRQGDVSASALPGQLQIEAAHLSTHLTVLRDKQVVTVQARGNHIYYSLSDPALLQAMDLIKQSFYARVGQPKTPRVDRDSER